MPDTRVARPRQRLFASVAATQHQQPGPAYERDLANRENPIFVPNRAAVRGRVDDVLAASEHLDVVESSLGRKPRSPYRLVVLEQDQAAFEDALDAERRAFRELLIALAARGRPPRRAALRRWARHLAWLRW